jgi:hypothetical protein
MPRVSLWCKRTTFRALTPQPKQASLALMLTPGRRLFQSVRSLRLRAIGLILVLVYVSAAAISVVVAHVLIVVQQQSVLGERLITPVARGLEFLDTHWKGVLILVVPFIAPVMQSLIPRLRKAGSLEFDAVQIEPVGVHEKPLPAPPGATL